MGGLRQNDAVVVIGLTGDVAAGKTTVAQVFAQLGAEVVDADRLGHEVLEMPAVRQRLVERWGPAVLDAEGRIDRRAVAQRVFGADAAARRERKFLEAVTHGPIADRLRQRLTRAVRRDGPPAVVVDAALLFEAGWDRFCAVTLFVAADAPTRRKRAQQRGWTDVQFAARQAAQLESNAKRRRADVVVDNSGDMGRIEDQVRAIWQRFVLSKRPA